MLFYIIIGLIIMAIIGLMIYMSSSSPDDELPPSSEPVVAANPTVPDTPLSFVISDPNNIKPNEKQSFT